MIEGDTKKNTALVRFLSDLKASKASTLADRKQSGKQSKTDLMELEVLLLHPEEEQLPL